MALTPGARIGVYEVTGLLGAGGMGEVYRARDTKLGRDVALKILPEAFTHESDRIARFQREAHVLASLNHPKIAAIYGLEETGGFTALVLELVDGPTLADRIAQGAVPLDEALPLARQIAEALEAAHEHGIIHRDLKPANIKVREDGSVKVLDFGLAKAMDPVGVSSANASISPTVTTPAMTQAGIILGTAAYMSPEQAAGRPVDKRSDLWAFGVVLLEMMTGRQVFNGETVSHVLASVLKDEPDWRALPATTPASIRTLLRRCLEKNRQRRLDSAAAACLEIDDALSARPAEETVVASPTPARWQRLMPLAVALVAAAFTGLAAWQFRPAQRSSPVTRFSIPVPEAQPFTNPGRVLLAFSPDGTSLVYNANSRLHLRAMSGLDEHVISGSEESAGLQNPVFSPDGKSLVFYSQADRSLKRLNLGGGTAVRICAADPVFGVNWNEQGIVFGQREKGILRVSPEGGTPEVIASVAADEIAANPQMLPDGRTVLFSVTKSGSVWDKGQIVAQRLADASRNVLIDGGTDGRYLPTGHLVYALQGVVLAVPFDPVKLVITGGSVPVIEGVRRALTTTSFGGPGVAHFSVSMTGSLAYIPGPVVTQGGATDLALFDRKGGAEPLKLPLGPYAVPRVSPSGQQIAFERDDEREASIWTYTLAGGGAAQRLTFGGNNRAPVWSADGEWLAYQSDREGDRAIFRQRADGTGTAERLTQPETGVTHTPQSSSADGAYLLFSAQKGSQSSLWTITLKDRKVAAYGDMNAREAAFSPNGRWIVYQVPIDGSTNAVFLEPFPRTGSRYQIPLPGSGGHPFWSPKGDEIIMNTGAASSTVIAVATEPSIRFGRPQPFPREGRNDAAPTTERRGSDMLPNGQQVIGVLTPEANLLRGQPQIVVVENWFEELKARVPPK